MRNLIIIIASFALCVLAVSHKELIGAVLFSTVCLAFIIVEIAEMYKARQDRLNHEYGMLCHDLGARTLKQVHDDYVNGCLDFPVYLNYNGVVTELQNQKELNSHILNSDRIFTAIQEDTKVLPLADYEVEL